MKWNVIKDELLRRLADILDARFQRTLFNKYRNLSGHAEAGVPQGSVFGPSLIGSTCCIFSDDASRFPIAGDPSISIDDIQHSLNKKYVWSNQ